MLILFLPLISCTEDEDEDDPGHSFIKKYVIEMSQDYKIYKVTKFDNTDRHYDPDKLVLERTSEYIYTDSLIKVVVKDSNEKVVRIFTYYLNQNHSADSCIDSSFNEYNQYVVSKNNYYYTVDGYLSSYERYDGLWNNMRVCYNYYYDNNNMSALISCSFTYGSFGLYYTYNELKNIVDIRHIIGAYHHIGPLISPYLGKNSNNLISEYKWIFPSPSGHIDSTITEYSYKLNSEGLVTRYSHDDYLVLFEYKYINK
jgi:hypothetical protein